MTLHDTEELDDDLRRGADEHLALAATLGIDNVVLREHEERDGGRVAYHVRGSRSVIFVSKTS